MPAPSEVFAPALARLEQKGESVFGPTGFRDYLSEHGLTANNTADRISINHFDALPKPLKDANTMVLRLGSGEGGRTGFALVRVKNVRDFFLHLDEPAVRTFLSPARMRDLVGYTLLAPSETTLVNLAFASGLVAHALELDEREPLAAPARGVLRATFDLQAHSSLEQILHHHNGQVEIDALFVGQRGGREHLFVIEAKQSGAALANHKLLYPVLAMARAVPSDMPIVPVYLRAQRQDGGYLFTVAECACPDPRAGVIALDALRPERVQALSFPLGMAGA